MADAPVDMSTREISSEQVTIAVLPSGVVFRPDGVAVLLYPSGRTSLPVPQS